MKYRVCPLCQGEGSVVNPALSVWTAEAIDQNPDAFEDMLKGRYNQQCPRCKGERVVLNEDDEQDAWEERESERRMMALESGDVEAYYEPY